MLRLTKFSLKNLITHFLSIQFGRYGVRRLVGQQQRYQILKQARHFPIFRFRVLELHVSAIHLVVLLTNEWFSAGMTLLPTIWRHLCEKLQTRLEWQGLLYTSATPREALWCSCLLRNFQMKPTNCSEVSLLSVLLGTLIMCGTWNLWCAPFAHLQ